MADWLLRCHGVPAPNFMIDLTQLTENLPGSRVKDVIATRQRSLATRPGPMNGGRKENRRFQP
jgi:hypothetical protein